MAKSMALINREQKVRRRQRGVCKGCARPRKTGHSRCSKCLRALRDEYARRAESGLCFWCDAEAVSRGKCEKHRVAANDAQRLRATRIRQLVMQHYGGKCSCCGETEDGVLTIDHIGGWGAKHRKTVWPGAFFYSWIIKNAFPVTLRLLCMNCNWYTRTGKRCYHEKD